MNISPQLRLSLGLTTILMSVILVADFTGMLPRPENQLRESRKLLAESLTVQLSSAVSNGQTKSLVNTLREIVTRNDEIEYSGIWYSDGNKLAEFGNNRALSSNIFDFSSYEELVIPIYQDDTRWGEVKLNFAPSKDWAMRFLGIPSETLLFILFIFVTCLTVFYLFLSKALSELNPTQAVPDRVNAAFDTLAEGVIIVDEDERIILANHSIASQIGEQADELVGKNLTTYEWDLNGEGIEELPWQAVLKRRENIIGMPLKLTLGNKIVSFTINASSIDNSNGELKGVLITFDDVTPLESKNAELASTLYELSATQLIIEEKNRELELLATRDPLTGCLNRRAFFELYEEKFSLAQNDEISLSVLMVDIDHFKNVNDNFGHAVGDDVIKNVGKLLNKHASSLDVVGRYGGEEFAFVIYGSDEETSKQFAESIRKDISALIHYTDIPLKELTVSIGLAVYEADVADHKQLLELADQALYKAKQQGRNRVCVYDPDYQHMKTSEQSAQRYNSDNLSKAETEVVDNLQNKLNKMQSVVNNQAKKISYLSMHDEITGLPNRLLLEDRVKQAIQLCKRNNSIIAIVSISLSGHQEMLDIGGHELAEDMLKQAIDRLNQRIRNVDSIGITLNEQSLTLSRIAHNELTLLIVDLERFDYVPKIAERIRKTLEEEFVISDVSIMNQVYCGISMYPFDGMQEDILIRNASLARGYAERGVTQQSNTVYFSKKIDAEVLRNNRMAQELRLALKNNELEVVYQPKINSSNNSICGVEVLTRWNHPEFGQAGPGEFISLAENIGLINQLTNWVLTRACRDILDKGIEGIRVAVNISPIELYDLKTADRILRVLKNNGVSPRQLEVEITESSLLNNFDRARKILTKLQSHGVLVSLDDFGTEYSSLNLLLELPVDIIKIDRSFINSIHNAPNNQAVVQAIILLGKSMGKRIVAEGVESNNELECLRSMGCDEIQGYLYSKPLHLNEFMSFKEKYGVYDTNTERNQTQISLKQLKKIAI